MTLDRAQLEQWGERIGAAVRTPVFFALRGDLGAGKSVLARAIARGAGVRALMPSPTFNLLFRYPTARGIDVVHLDLYRLERAADVRELGWRELGLDHELVLVEWPERAEALLPSDRWDIVLDRAGEDTRHVSARPHGNASPIPFPEV